jgi:hypothetical protein
MLDFRKHLLVASGIRRAYIVNNYSRYSMRHILGFVVSCFLVVIGLSDASGWGGNGHNFINRKAVYHLPNQMLLFIQDSSFFALHASDADNRRTDDTTSLYGEKWRHFLDIDDYPNFRNLPQSLDTLIALYGLVRVKNNGTNPWTTLWFYDSLVAQLRRGDWTNAKHTAADIGHYVGDAHQPLHVTKNYNGQFTGQSGIHSRYESTMLSSTYFLSALAITPDSVQYVGNRWEFVFLYLLHSNNLVDTVLQGDIFAKSVSGGNINATYYNALWNRTRRITLDQMQRGTKALAAFWYSAWVDAGLISTTGVLPQAATKPIELGLAQNYPNPFNPSTTISYSLPVGGTVSLKILSVDGKEVATLVSENQSAGEHVVRFVAPATLSSGVYFYQLRLGNFSQTKRFMLLK